MIAAALLLLASPGAHAGDAYRSLAREFSRAGAKAEIRRIAVLPFASVDGSRSLDGEGVAERLTTQLIRAGRPQVVERRLLERVMEEHRLMSTGLIRQAEIKRLGELLSADAVLTGSLFETKGRLEIHARLIEVETGRALHAAQAEVEPDWALTARVPSLEVAPPAFEVPAPLFLRDAIGSRGSVDCADAEARLEVLERGSLGLKARFWAARLREPGFSPAELKRNPGSEIADPELRARFYGLLRAWSAAQASPELTAAERRMLADGEEEAEGIRTACQSLEEGGNT